jgi:Zn-dependent metalloprotease
MKHKSDIVDLSRIATDWCSLPDEMLDCLKRIAARSLSPIVVSAEYGQSLQLHGHFEVERSSEARWDFVKTLLNCLGTRQGLEFKRSEPCDGGESELYDLLFQGVPVYRGGVSITVSANGRVIESVVISLPRSSPQQGKWGDEGAAEQTLRKRWGLDDVGAPWLVRRGRKMWYAASLVHGSSDSESWQPAWVFGSGGTAENPFDVVVSGDGGKIIDTAMVGNGGRSLAPLPRYHLRPATGVPDFITWGQTGLLLPEAGSGDAQRAARALFDRYPTLFGTGDSLRQLTAVRTDVSTGLPRTRHVVFQQMFGSVPVYGCQLRVHFSPTLAIRSVTGTYLRDPQVSLDVKVPEAQAMLLLGLRSGSGDERQKAPLNEMTPRGLVVFPAVLAAGGGAINHLTWWIATPKWHFFVSAESGRIVYQLAAQQDARFTYDANQMDSGEVLDVRDGVVVTQGGGPPDVDSVATDATVGLFEGFLLGLFGWRSWDNRGSDDIAIVDYPNGGNARWSHYDKRARFDRNFTTSEVIGHEFTHGIAQASAAFNYVAESGALDESFADVIGKLAFPGSPPNWIVRNNDGTVIRDMANPMVAKYSQFANLPLDHFGVHSNSGIGNLAAVLFCDGSVPTRGGLGRELTARLWWDVLTLRLHPWATYMDFSLALREAVRDLASMGSAGVAAPASPAATGAPIPTFDQMAVDQADWALDKVELSPALHSGWFTIPGVFHQTLPFFRGAVVPASEVVTSVELLISRHRDADRSEFLFGRAVSPGVPTFSDQSGTLVVKITSDGVGTTSKQFTAEVMSIAGVNTELEPNVYTMPVSPPATTPQPVVTPWSSPYIAHWFDNPFFAGRKYGDIIFETMGVSASCTVLDVWLEILEKTSGGLLVPRGQARLGGPSAVLGGTGVTLVDAHPGTSELEAKVRSWHDFGQIVRYRIVYVISGGCMPTAFGFREVNPATLP